MQHMRLIVTGGGTGGHLFPGIALATAMQERVPGTQMLFIGTSRLLDQEALADRGFELATLNCGGVKGLSVARKMWSLAQMVPAVWAAWRMLRRFRPDLVFGVGGYVTGPVLLTARMLGVPVVIHEQNSVPGMANRLAGRLADRICISLPCESSFPSAKTVQTGNPVRQEILAAAKGERPAQEVPTLLILGGSQGAHRVNLLTLEAAELLVAEGLPVRFIHQTGKADEAIVREAYRRLGVEAEVSAFISDMAGVYGRADLAVSRAGATTLAELAVMGLPALLVPYPFAADNHQLMNGKCYEKAGGCIVFEEAVMTGPFLAKVLSERLHNRAELHTMTAKMRAMALPEAAARIVDECLRLVPPLNGKFSF